MSEKCDLFPGWTPEHGESRYGYPLPPNMAALSDSEVRQWGRHRIDAQAEYDLLAALDAPCDLEWLIHLD